MPDSTLTDRVVGNTVIRSLPPLSLVPETDALVEEQDTWLLLGVTPQINDTTESFPSLVKKMEKQEPLVPGSIITRGGTPRGIIAIIYDIDQKPLCRDEWIEGALQKIIDECERNKICSLLMPVLGARHGGITHDHFMQLLDTTLSSRNAGFPKLICLMP